MLDRITWFKQAALRWQDDDITVYIDPWGTSPDDPPADLILITHAHDDHFQPDEIDHLRTDGTKIVAPHDVAQNLQGDITPVAPGESHEVAGVHFTTVPAYNTREEALELHPQANRWVGFIVELGGATYYHAGDTDHAPELDDVTADVSFLPIGGYYTMDPEEAAGLAKRIRPKLAVPMHYGFVIGSPSFGDRFKEAAAPVAVEIMTPVNPFEME